MGVGFRVQDLDRASRIESMASGLFGSTISALGKAGCCFGASGI